MRYTKKIGLIIAAVILLPMSVSAQNTVEVKKDFENDLTGVTKSSRKRTLPDSLKNLKTNFSYEITEKQFKNVGGFSPLPSKNISSKMMAEYPVFLAKAGIAYPLESDAALFFNPRLPKSKYGSSNNLFVKLEYDNKKEDDFEIAKADGKKLTDSGLEALRLDRSFGLGFGYGREWKKGSFNTDFFYKSSHDTYSGFFAESLPEYRFAPNTRSYPLASEEHLKRGSFMKDNLSHSFDQMGGNISINSVAGDGSEDKFHYNIDLSYTKTYDKAKLLSPVYFLNTGIQRITPELEENYIKAKIEGGPSTGKYSNATIGVDFESAYYDKVQDYHHSLFGVYASYTFTKGNWALDLGARLSLDFNNKDAYDGEHTLLSPMVSITYNLIDNRMWAYLTAEGGNDLNHYSSLLEKCSVVSPLTDMRSTAILTDSKIGLRGSISRNFTYNIYGGYANRKGMAQLVAPQAVDINDYSALDLAYSNHVELLFGGELNYKSEDFSMGVSAKYSYFDKSKKRFRNMVLSAERPYGYSPLEADVFAEYNFRGRVKVGTNATYCSKAPQLTNTLGVKSPAFLNWNFYGEYSIDKNFSVYGQLRNILDSENIEYANYLGDGFSVMFGILIKL